MARGRRTRHDLTMGLRRAAQLADPADGEQRVIEHECCEAHQKYQRNFEGPPESAHPLEHENDRGDDAELCYCRRDRVGPKEGAHHRIDLDRSRVERPDGKYEIEKIEYDDRCQHRPEPNGIPAVGVKCAGVGTAKPFVTEIASIKAGPLLPESEFEPSPTISA